jgi:glycosyltransferase involved in cell wall biosynthesis
MAAGVPVIAMDLGSCRELIEDGVSGYLINTVDEAADAVARIDAIDRSACRKRVEENFTIDCMVAGYERVYQEIFQREAQKTR